MRFAIAALCGLFLTANLAGCSGTTNSSAPENAKPGPPPGTSDDWSKGSAKKKNAERPSGLRVPG